MLIVNLAKKAQRINVRRLALANAKANAGLINELVEQQLIVGENSKSQDIGKLKSNPYATRKKSRGGLAPFGVVDLKFSGGLYKGLGTTFTNNNFTTKSSVSYSIYQEKRYGDTVYLMQDQNAEEIEEKVLVETIADYVKDMGL